MDRRLAPALVRIVFATLAIAAVVAQFVDDAVRGVLVPVNFFSYFTIQSNLIGAAAFLATAASWRKARPVGLELLRGASAVYLTVTLVVFALLLSSTSTPSWMNTVLHRAFPLAVILDWIFALPSAPIAFRRSLVWLVYPIAWVAHTLARGVLTGWFPYPFVDPANGGYVSVALYIVAIFAFGVVLCGLASAVTGWRRKASGETAGATV